MLMGLPPEGEIPDKPHASVHRLRLEMKMAERGGFEPPIRLLTV